MEQYIKKSAVIAEINRIKKEECPTDSYEGRCKLLWFEQFLTFLNTLEVKDVDEIIKNAEDHAYFAGSENTREKLINEACKWWEVELTYPSMTPEEFKRCKSKVRMFRKDMENK